MTESDPRLRNEAVGFNKERGRVKNSVTTKGRGSWNVLQQRGQQGRGGGLDINKKFRGDQVRIKKQNSHSSIVSDLRSSHAAFMWSGSVADSGKQCDKPINYDGDRSNKAEPSKEVRPPYHKMNGGIEDLSKVDLVIELFVVENF